MNIKSYTGRCLLCRQTIVSKSPKAESGMLCLDCLGKYPMKVVKTAEELAKSGRIDKNNPSSAKISLEAINNAYLYLYPLGLLFAKSCQRLLQSDANVSV